MGCLCTGIYIYICIYIYIYVHYARIDIKAIHMPMFLGGFPTYEHPNMMETLTNLCKIENLEVYPFPLYSWAAPVLGCQMSPKCFPNAFQTAPK